MVRLMGSALVLLLAMSPLAFGNDKPADSSAYGDVERFEEGDVKNGAKLYKRLCRGCHGEDGRGGAPHLHAPYREPDQEGLHPSSCRTAISTPPSPMAALRSARVRTCRPGEASSAIATSKTSSPTSAPCRHFRSSAPARTPARPPTGYPRIGRAGRCRPSQESVVGRGCGPVPAQSTL